MDKLTKPPDPDHLTINLFAPGMSALHRAGLGGLACTLKAIERQFKAGLLAKENLPALLDGYTLPWKIEEQTITLNFGKPQNAGEYLRKLFAFAFQIRDGLIYLPGQYLDPPPSLAVRAEMQTALTRTFLQGAKRNVGLESACPYLVDPDGSGVGVIEIQFQKCNWYLHQQVWKALVDDEYSTVLDSPKKKLDGKKNVNFGSLYPGAIKRHDVFSESEATETTPGLLCCLFFLVGCAFARLSNSGDAILLIPDVQNIEEFTVDRPYMTPQTVAEVRVGGVADAAYQAEVRTRARCLLMASTIPSCRALRFSLRTWTKPQKSRVDAAEVSTEQISRFESETPTEAERRLSQYEIAMAVLPRGVRVKKTTELKSKGKKVTENEVGFWVDSTIRPHIAANLALGRPWYDRFNLLFGDKKITKQVKYETGGLQAMAKNRTLTDDDEAHFIAAIHRAIYMGRGRIYAETMGQDAVVGKRQANIATKKRWEKFSERLRLQLVGAKTETQAQDAISELLARNGPVKELRDQQAVHLIRRILFDVDWKRARNLALFALASYVRPANVDPISGDTEDVIAVSEPTSNRIEE